MWLTILLVVAVVAMYFQMEKMKAEMKDCCTALADLYVWANRFQDAVIKQFEKCGCPQDPDWPPEGPGTWPK